MRERAERAAAAGGPARRSEGGGVDGPDTAAGPREPMPEGGGVDGPDTAGGSRERMSPRLVLLLAVATGATVANLYYVQPLLDMVARGFGTAESSAALLVTFTQLGYVSGIALLVPLGDLVERRRLITTLLLVDAVALAGCAAAPALPALALALFGVGALSAVAQVVVPLASVLAAPGERGRVVGTVMGGLLIGILTARTISGLIAEAAGWRMAFVLAAAGMVALSTTLRRALPVVPPGERVAYRAALRSVLTMVSGERVLRQRMVFGALGMAGFSLLWTSLPFLLSDPPFDYTEAVIGLFGLAGAAGALAAMLAGRWADRGDGRLAFTVFLLLVLAGWGVLALGSSSAILVAGIVVVDIGIQGAHITNQTVIYRLSPAARSRITTAYMIAVFLGGAVGSVLAATVDSAGGWGVTCAAGALVAALAVAIWIVVARPRRAGRTRVGAGASDPVESANTARSLR